MKAEKILFKVLVTLAVIEVVLNTYYFATTKTAFDGSWEHTYYHGLILFFCVLLLTVLFFKKLSVKNRKLQERALPQTVEANYELTSDENDFVEFFILYSKERRIPKNYLENFFYDNFRLITLEYTTKFNGDTFRLNNVPEVIKRAKEKYHDH